MKTSLEHKTVRPGSLSDYSFYYSNRQPVSRPAAEPKQRGGMRKYAVIAVLLLVIGGGLFSLQAKHATPTSADSAAVTATKATTAKTSKTPAVATTTPAVNACAGNTLDKLIKVSIQKRHLWACDGTKVAYDTPVITGMEKHASTLTPLGTYKIYGKVADTVLTGSDETGTWRDPVSYWMPFLDNQYGTYGFHDATWRDANEFGNIDANTSDDASHGCVELPLGSSKWLYEWSPVGTTLTVEA